MTEQQLLGIFFIFFFPAQQSPASIPELVETKLNRASLLQNSQQFLSLESSREALDADQNNRRAVFGYRGRKVTDASDTRRYGRTQDLNILTPPLAFSKFNKFFFSFLLSAPQPGNTQFSQTGAVCWPAAKTEFKKSSRHGSSEQNETSASCFSCQEHLQWGFFLLWRLSTMLSECY